MLRPGDITLEGRARRRHQRVVPGRSRRLGPLGGRADRQRRGFHRPCSHTTAGRHRQVAELMDQGQHRRRVGGPQRHRGARCVCRSHGAASRRRPVRACKSRIARPPSCRSALLGIYAEGAVELRLRRLLVPHGAALPRPASSTPASSSIRASTASRSASARSRTRCRSTFGLSAAHGWWRRDSWSSTTVQVSTSRADDRVELRFRSLSVEEIRIDGEPDRGAGRSGGEAARRSGTRASSSQQFTARRLSVHAERLPVFYLPEAGLRHERGLPRRSATPSAASTPGRKSGGRVGSSSGALGFPIGDAHGPAASTYEVSPAATTRSAVGPSAGRAWSGITATSKHTIRSRGYFEPWVVWDNKTFDSDGELRCRPSPRAGAIVSESRTHFREDLYADMSLGYFSDRRLQQRVLRARRPPCTAIATPISTVAGPRSGRGTSSRRSTASGIRGTWETETVQRPGGGGVGLPGAAAQAAPPGAGSPSTSRAMNRGGYLGRRFDTQRPDSCRSDYDAWRFLSDTQANFGVDVGDVRLSGPRRLRPAHGLRGSQRRRTRIMARTAILAGLRANLQLHKVYNALRRLVRAQRLASHRRLRRRASAGASPTPPTPTDVPQLRSSWTSSASARAGAAARAQPPADAACERRRRRSARRTSACCSGVRRAPAPGSGPSPTSS